MAGRWGDEYSFFHTPNAVTAVDVMGREQLLGMLEARALLR